MEDPDRPVRRDGANNRVRLCRIPDNPIQRAGDGFIDCINSAGAGTIYTVNETITSPLNGIVGNPTQTDSVVGTITTDGTIGVLHSADISSWNLDLIDVTTPANTYELTTSNSSIVVDFGSVLNASATGLFFDFTNTGGFGFQANVPGPYSGYHYW